jgi:hypothetical protein
VVSSESMLLHLSIDRLDCSPVFPSILVGDCLEQPIRSHTGWAPRGGSVQIILEEGGATLGGF